MHGSADSAITMDQFADLAKKLESTGIAHEMIPYGGAQHAFTVFKASGTSLIIYISIQILKTLVKRRFSDILRDHQYSMGKKQQI